ncbi:MAG: hypothetical protein ACOYJB_08520 [Christensenellaceae bacterium]|jgi:hypothetical protein
MSVTTTSTTSSTSPKTGDENNLSLYIALCMIAGVAIAGITVYRAHNNIDPNRVPYDFRHTFFSVTKNLPDSLVRPIGGHSPKFDNRTYIHEIEGDDLEAATQVDAVYRKVLKMEKEDASVTKSGPKEIKNTPKP